MSAGFVISVWLSLGFLCLLANQKWGAKMEAYDHMGKEVK
jgi:hypothetical protein